VGRGLPANRNLHNRLHSVGAPAKDIRRAPVPAQECRRCVIGTLPSPHRGHDSSSVGSMFKPKGGKAHLPVARARDHTMRSFQPVQERSAVSHAEGRIVNFGWYARYGHCRFAKADSNAAPSYLCIAGSTSAARYFCKILSRCFSLSQKHTPLTLGTNAGW